MNSSTGVNRANLTEEQKRIFDAFKAWHAGNVLTAQQREDLSAAIAVLNARNFGVTL